METIMLGATIVVIYSLLNLCQLYSDVLKCSEWLVKVLNLSLTGRTKLPTYLYQVLGHILSMIMVLMSVKVGCSLLKRLREIRLCSLRTNNSAEGLADSVTGN